MKRTMHAITAAFGELLRWDILKIALLSGLIVTAFWLLVGGMFQESLIALGSAVLEYIPFSMVRSNGAWMLSAFLWFQFVLLTFALIYAFFGNVMLRTTSKERYSSYSILILIGSALLWGLVWFFKGEMIYQEFLKLLTWLPFETVEKGLAALVGLYVIYNAMIITLLFLTSLMSQPLLASMARRHFPEEKVVRSHWLSSIGVTLKDTVIYLGLSLIAFPLLFIPVLNLIVQTALWGWLVKDTMSHDALALTYDRPNAAQLKEHRTAIYVISLVSVLFYFVPFLHIFGPFFGELAMFHYFQSLKKEAK